MPSLTEHFGQVDPATTTFGLQPTRTLTARDAEHIGGGIGKCRSEELTPSCRSAMPRTNARSKARYTSTVGAIRIVAAAMRTGGDGVN